MFDAIKIYRVANFLYRKKIPLVPKLLQLFIFIVYNSYIPYQSQIGKKTNLGYGGIGVVIHSRAVIGENVMIGPNVTIGGRSGKKDVPIIGNSVYIATGAKILGNINVGNNSIIGANAVVIHDVPENAVVAGVPAKIIKFQK